MARVKPAKAKKKTEWSVPQSAEEEATRQVRGLKNPRIQAGLKGRFIYVYIDWDPLCRFEYEGSDSVWRFALYRSGTGRYSNDVFPCPTRNRIDNGIQTALEFYPFM